MYCTEYSHLGIWVEYIQTKEEVARRNRAVCARVTPKTASNFMYLDSPSGISSMKDTRHHSPCLSISISSCHSSDEKESVVICTGRVQPNSVQTHWRTKTLQDSVTLLKQAVRTKKPNFTLAAKTKTHKASVPVFPLESVGGHKVKRSMYCPEPHASSSTYRERRMRCSLESISSEDKTKFGGRLESPSRKSTEAIETGYEEGFSELETPILSGTKKTPDTRESSSQMSIPFQHENLYQFHSDWVPQKYYILVHKRNEAYYATESEPMSLILGDVHYNPVYLSSKDISGGFHLYSSRSDLPRTASDKCQEVMRVQASGHFVHISESEVVCTTVLPMEVCSQDK